MDKFINTKLAFTNEIEYSPDAVVSKTIYKGPHCILTIFALAKDQSIAEHITPFEALVQVLEGSVELTIGGAKKIVTAGESIIMPANIPHALLAISDYKMLLTMMK